MLNKVKAALRLTVNDYDGELTNLISAAIADLGLVGINDDKLVETDSLVSMAVITYCRMRFGSPSDYDKLKASYDEQKAQMISATGYGMEADA